MVAFVIFWSAAFVIIFFILGIFFKALASAFNALMSSIGEILAVGGLAGLAGVALYLLYAIIDGIIKEGFWSVIGTIVMLFIVIGIVGAIAGGLGALILEIVVMVVGYALMIISAVLEWAADLCERSYAKFLKAIISRLDKC